VTVTVTAPPAPGVDAPPSGVSADGTLLVLALAKLLLHATAITRYGYFRDELYYLVCAQHPAAGYVDQPPLSIWILGLVRALCGDSLIALRWLPAVVGAATVFVTGRIARELGGGRFAQAVAALAALIAPVFLGTDHFYSMNSFDILIWTLCAWITLRALSSASPRPWLLLGVVLGLGLLNKISVLWLIAGLGAGILVSPSRRALLTPWPWCAIGIAFAIFAPNVIWQIQHGWPTLEFMRNATGRKMVAVSPAGFIAGQALSMNPVTLPLWLAGLVWLLFAHAGRAARPLGVMYVAVALFLIAGGRSRVSYLSPAYVSLFAAGAVAFERATAMRGRGLRGVAVALMLLLGAAALPLALPVLPADAYIRYARALGLAPSTEEHQRIGRLPQHYADMFGWQELVDEVEKAYRSLTPDEQARCSIFAQNYGEAGAITVLGRRRGLPAALSGHNNFWLWGPGPRDGEVMIIVGGDRADNERVFRELTQVGTVRSKYSMPYEQDMPIFVGRGLKIPIRELWPQLKEYI
jgi:4-amino-4-deoxy-L-arabinose transferase-like glycosyltransferase